MGPFDKIKRRNLDFLLIETIKQIGVSNYSLLARMTGLNPETVRYKVSKQLSRYGLGVQLNLNYAEFGMSVGMMLVDSDGSRNWTDDVSYLFFEGKVVGSNKYVCLFAVPFRFKKKHADILASLKQKKEISEFDMLDTSWVRYPTFRSEFYNFDEKRWAVDWRKVEMTMGEVGAMSHEVNRDAEIDYFDVRILKAMQQNPTVSLAKVAGDMKANPRTVRYHHAEHVVNKKFILNSNVRWQRPLFEDKPGDLMQVAVLFRALPQEKLAEARKLMNKIPFSWIEAGTTAGDYFALLDVPLEGFYDTIRYIESNVEDIKSNFTMHMLDSHRTRTLYIPDEMFDPRRGWTLPGYKQEMAQVPEEKEN